MSQQGARWSGRPLRLNHPPDLEHAPVHAGEIVGRVKQADQIDLDYSPASLEHVDEILGRFHRAGAGSDSLAEALWGFGCYVGEVFVRHAEGSWTATPAEYQATLGFPIVVTYRGKLANPIGKVFNRVDAGDEHNLPYFYRVMTAQSG